MIDRESNSGGEPTPDFVPWMRLDMFDLRPPEWLMEPWIPAGAVTYLAGEGGAGKSALLARVACHVSRGHVGDPAGGNVLLMNDGEENPGRWILPRALAAGGDPEKMRVAPRQIPDFPEGIAALRKAVDFYRAALVVIDPIASRMSGDPNNPADVRRVMSKLEIVAQDTGAAIVLIGHLNKLVMGKTRHRVSGSHVWVDAARWVLMAEQWDEESKRGTLRVIKGNLADKPLPLDYQIVPVPFTFPDGRTHSFPFPKWGDEVEPRPRKKPAKRAEPAAPEIDKTARAVAKAFLEEMIPPGSREGRRAKDVKAAAKARGISPRTLQRACNDARVVRTKRGNAVYWRRPAEAEPAPA